jgi:hypothetical protein
MEENQLKENVDFYWDEAGLMVLTKDYLLKRGYCCENGCRHCPYGSLRDEQSKAL